jgi:uncharacterized cofD-like protein
VAGESAIPEARLPIERVYLEPSSSPAYPPALRAILDADLIALGPGSLFTSVMPNLLVDDITRAIRASNALCVYVCNVATQPGETDGFTVGDHAGVIERHIGTGLFSFVLANNNSDHPLPADSSLIPVSIVTPIDADYKVFAADVVDEGRPWRHHPGKLARVLMTMVEQREETKQGVPIGLNEEA